MHRDRQTDYVNSGNFDTVVENKIGAGINFPEATRILLTCYIKSRKVLRSHLSIYGIQRRWIPLQTRMIIRGMLPKCRTRTTSTCCTNLMLMTHGNISLMGFPWKAPWKEGVKRLIPNTRGFTFPNRRKLLRPGKTELIETSQKCVCFARASKIVL